MTTMTRSHGVSSSEFWRRAVETSRVGFRANRLRSVQIQEFEAQAARVLSDGRLGHASTTDVETGQDALIDRAMRSAQHGKPVGIMFPSTRVEMAAADPALSNLTSTELAALGEEMIAIIRQADPRAKVDLEIRRSCERTQIRNSEGGAALALSSQVAADVWVERHQGDHALVLFSTFKSAHSNGHHRRCAERVARSLAWATQPVQVRSGRSDVILSPAAVATLIQPLIMALSGARARHGNSPLASKRGQRLFDPRLMLVDDGTLRDRPNGGVTDHEGVPAQRTVLIADGVVKNFYYDLHAAALANTTSTGNGRRETLAPPRPMPTNIILAPGSTSLESMIASLDEGLLVDILLESGMASGLRGAFSRTIVLGHRIEHGRMAGYIKGAALAGDLYKMLGRGLVALGDTPTWVGDVCAPYMLVSGLNVTF